MLVGALYFGGGHPSQAFRYPNAGSEAQVLTGQMCEPPVEVVYLPDGPLADQCHQGGILGLDEWIAGDYSWPPVQMPDTSVIACMLGEEVIVTYEPQTQCTYDAEAIPETLGGWMAVELPEPPSSPGLLSMVADVMIGVLLAVIIILIFREVDAFRRRARAIHEGAEEALQAATLPVYPERAKGDALLAAAREVLKRDRDAEDVRELEPAPEAEDVSGVSCQHCQCCPGDPMGLVRRAVEQHLLPAVWGKVVVHNGSGHRYLKARATGEEGVTHFFCSYEWSNGRKLDVVLGGTHISAWVQDPPEDAEILVTDEVSGVPLVFRVGPFIMFTFLFPLSNEFFLQKSRNGMYRAFEYMVAQIAAAIQPDADLLAERQRQLCGQSQAMAMAVFAERRKQVLHNRADALRAELTEAEQEEAQLLGRFRENKRELIVSDLHQKALEQAQAALKARCVEAVHALHQMKQVDRSWIGDDLNIVYTPGKDGVIWSVSLPLHPERAAQVVWTKRIPHENSIDEVERFTAPAGPMLNVVAQPLEEVNLVALAMRLQGLTRSKILIPYNREGI